MSQAIAKYAAKKMLTGELKKYQTKKPEGDYDPYYEMRINPKTGKPKKYKKQIPAYIPAHDADILARARKSAYRLDYSLFNFLGIRFGWSSVIGLVPAAGDVIDLLLAYMVVKRMKEVDGGLPSKVLGMMYFWLFADLLIGLVPFVGDLLDATIKCNSRNVRLLEQHLDDRYKPKQIRELEQAMDASVRPRPATVYEDFSDEDEERRNTFDDRHDDVRQPTRAYSGRRERRTDEEMGLPRHDTHRSERDRRNQNGTRSSRR